MTVSKLSNEAFAAFAAAITKHVQPGAKLTLIDISEGMAMTSKREIVIKQALMEPQFIPHYVNATHGHYRLGTGAFKGKRKEFYIDLDGTSLLFAGWDCPVKIDSEISNQFAGNACLNLGGVSVSELRKLIEDFNLNTLFSGHASVLHVTPGVGNFAHNIETLAYPELDSRGHAVIERMKEDLEEAEGVAA
jgi:hypothetical protein